MDPQLKILFDMYASAIKRWVEHRDDTATTKDAKVFLMSEAKKQVQYCLNSLNFAIIQRIEDDKKDNI